MRRLLYAHEIEPVEAGSHAAGAADDIGAPAARNGRPNEPSRRPGPGDLAGTQEIAVAPAGDAEAGEPVAISRGALCPELVMISERAARRDRTSTVPA